MIQVKFNYLANGNSLHYMAGNKFYLGIMFGGAKMVGSAIAGIL